MVIIPGVCGEDAVGGGFWEQEHGLTGCEPASLWYADVSAGFRGGDFLPTVQSAVVHMPLWSRDPAAVMSRSDTVSRVAPPLTPAPDP